MAIALVALIFTKGIQYTHDIKCKYEFIETSVAKITNELHKKKRRRQRATHRRSFSSCGRLASLKIKDDSYKTGLFFKSNQLSIKGIKKLGSK
jgi:hypothetical protein